MKRLFTLLTALLTFIVAVNAQSASYDQFPIKVTGGLTNNSIISQYYWDSPIYTFAKAVDGIRITFLKNNTGESFKGFPIVAIADITVYDRSYNIIDYPADKITTNSLEASEGSLAGIADNNWDSYYHSAWKYASITPEDYVYIDIKFNKPQTSFCFTIISRNLKTAPESIIITESGVKYDGSGESGGNSGSNGDNNDSEGGSNGDIEFEPVDIFSEDICYVYLRNGGIDAYQRSTMEGDYTIQNDTLAIKMKDGTTATYSQAEYDSCSSVRPELPTMTSYKFNNKYNANLNVDVIADSVESVMNFSLNAIGKSLTASFNLSDNRAVAYVGQHLQTSKESRIRFDKPIHYAVTYPGYNIIQKVKVKDEVWDYGEEIVEEIPLSADMLSTNKPSEVGDDLDNMLDNNPSTVFHTVYGANYNASVIPYIQIELKETVQNVRFYYMSRTSGNYNPTGLKLYASNDGYEWTPVAQYSTADGLPIDPAGAEYTSPTIDLGKGYKYLRLEQTSSEYHNNHMVFAEFRLYEVTPGSGEPTLVQEAVYETVKIPFGRLYTIDIEWLTDRQNAVPRIDIDVEGGYSITSKDYYRKANFRITGYGVFEDFEDSVEIKGRGNSTWGYPKKPYRLKFDKKKKPFGLTNGKSWVLLANYQRGSLMANAIAMKVGQLAEAQYTNHIIPVEVYMNGEYKGSYMFTEKVGFANNSVDIDEDLGTGYMLELDDYYDETYKFKSNSYSLPVNVKEPDLSDIADATEAQQKFQNIKNDFNAFETALYNGEDIAYYLDLDAAARFMLANDLVLNQELGHPKSTYLWREDYTNPASKIILGPLWDFDWAFGYESTSSYCVTGATSSILSNNMYYKAGYRFFYDLMNNAQFKKHYLKVWKEFAQKGHIQEVIEYMDDYYNFAKSSFENNYMLWYDGYGYDSDIDRMQQWMQQRHDFILANLDDVDITDILYTLTGDVDCNSTLTVHDISLAVNKLAGKEAQGFNFKKADTNNNGRIDKADVNNITGHVLAADPISSLYYFNTPMTNALLVSDDFEAVMEENSDIQLTIKEFGEREYKSIQIDVEVPVGAVLNDATFTDGADNSMVQFNQIGENSYRVVSYLPDNNTFINNEAFANLSLNIAEVIPEEECTIKMTNILVVDNDNTERRLDNLNVDFTISTGISSTAATATVRGGEQLTISLLKAQNVDIYAVDGRKVLSIKASEGTTKIDLPAGIYVVLGKKVIIR